MTTKTTTTATTTRERLFSAETGALRGDVTVREKNGRLYALIGSRWCRVERRDDGALVEIWTK